MPLPHFFQSKMLLLGTIYYVEMLTSFTNVFPSSLEPPLTLAPPLALLHDNANEFIIGKAYNELDLEDFGIGLSIASQGAGVFWRTTKHIRWFGPAIRAIPIDWAMMGADEGTKSFLRFLQVSYEMSESNWRDYYINILLTINFLAIRTRHPRNFGRSDIFLS